MLHINLLEVLECLEPQVFKDFTVLLIVQQHRDMGLRRRVEKIISDGSALDLRPLKESAQLVVFEQIVIEDDESCLRRLIQLFLLPLTAPDHSVLLFHPSGLNITQHLHLWFQLCQHCILLQYSL